MPSVCDMLVYNDWTAMVTKRSPGPMVYLVVDVLSGWCLLGSLVFMELDVLFVGLHMLRFFCDTSNSFISGLPGLLGLCIFEWMFLILFDFM